jgi:cysteinyl-tRNA synthetase
VFPHHENEIAQSESFTGKPFARFWLHNGMLQLAGEKMSKSLGNLVTIDEFLAQHSADAFRMLILNSSYRGPLTFTEEVVQQAENALERLKGGLRPASASAAGAPQAGQDLAERAGQATSGFLAAMDDDFNTSVALGHIFELVRQINQARDRGATAVELGSAQETLRELTGVLGLRLEERTLPQQQAAPFVELLLELREELRLARQYVLADRIRDRLGTLGVVLEDGKDGTTWRLR